VESEGEPEVAPEAVPEQAPTEGAMIAVHTAAAPPLSHGARAPLSSPVVALGVAASEGMEVVLGNPPPPYASGDIFVDEAVSTAHQALSQAQRVPRRECEYLADERRRLQLWASMLKRTTMSERAAAWARQHGFDLQVEAIAQHDIDCRRALNDAPELYTSVKARANAVTKLEEELDARARQVNQWEQEAEKLEGLLQEREELDDITLRRELEALSTRETSLDRHEADLEREQKALEDVHAQVLARELDADARDTGLRD
jgi:hypothetical protein